MMRLTVIRTLAMLAALATMLAAAPAGASDGTTSVVRRLADARSARETKLATIDELGSRLDDLLTRYEAVERRAGRAALDVARTSQAVRDAELQLADARGALEDGIRRAYELGPSTMVQAMLSADSFADAAMSQEYTSRALGIGAATVEAHVEAVDHLRRDMAAAEAARVALAPRQRRLAAMLEELRATLAEAQAIAERLGLRIDHLQEQARAVAEAASREVGRNLLQTGATGEDQVALLALLGPTGGRTCDTPPGLVDTGKRLTGYASWYGWEFAGQSTANGAIFDPTLFTAANRWLPFGTFLRVRYGDRCAIVLVNDRGPYGHLERVIDLSWAAADYLGVGVSYVQADILLPAGDLPDA